MVIPPIQSILFYRCHIASKKQQGAPWELKTPTTVVTPQTGCGLSVLWQTDHAVGYFLENTLVQQSKEEWEYHLCGHAPIQLHCGC